MILKVEPLVNSFVRLLHESIEKVPVNCLCSSAPPCFHKKRNVALLKTMLFLPSYNRQTKKFACMTANSI